MTLEAVNQDVCAITEELGPRMAMARYGLDPDEATTFALVAGGDAYKATAILHGLMVGAAYAEQLQLAKETDS